ncbi:MAG: acetylxylan esterase [Planctomyces sp.]|nr:acetylxylan esterase [Planctomyces sp.]
MPAERLSLRLRGCCLCLALSFVATGNVVAEDAAAKASRVNPPGQLPNDARLKLRTTYDEYHPWTPPRTKAAWEQEAARLRRQILVSCGLWPLPEKPTIEAEIHGLVEREDYTVERVSFASRPGLYVTGSLYRPRHVDGPRPAILCPHGHWQNGRFYDAGQDAAQKEIDSGAESFLSGARYPLQARMVQLAKLGCVVFHYDMLGVADHQAFGHSGGFNDAQAELWLENRLGLQTWNSIRALDFVSGLPDVDPERIGVTGASGGGTQTFLLCALDSRPKVAFPAVMVSAAMQGGCQCENASYLRLGTNNVAFAALMAPRPQALSGANDWTIDIETKGLPELKTVYGFYGQADLVEAKCFPQFGHNYNEVAREMMYAWMARHLGLEGPLEQVDFVPLSRAELAVYGEGHPRPDEEWGIERLREDLTREARERFASLIPKAAGDVAKYREVVGGAAAVMLDSGLPSVVNNVPESEEPRDGYKLIRARVGRPGEEILTVAFAPEENFNGEIVLWFDGRGKACLFDESGQPTSVIRDLLGDGYAVASGDLFLTGEYVSGDAPAAYPVDETFAGYTFGFNAPLISQRVRDILTLVAAVRQHVPTVHLVGTGDAGLWVLLARSASAEVGESVTADLRGFRFANVQDTKDPNLLPGALRYGDVDGLAALAVGGRLAIYGAAGDWPATRAMADATEKKVRIREQPLDAVEISVLFERD